MVSMEDAWSNLSLAKNTLKNLDYSACVHRSQRCIELSIKSLLDSLNIKYKWEHRVGNELGKVLEKLNLKEYDVNYLARANMHLMLWTSVANLAEYGDQYLHVAARKIFTKEDAELALGHAQRAYSLCSRIVSTNS